MNSTNILLIVFPSSFLPEFRHIPDLLSLSVPLPRSDGKANDALRGRTRRLIRLSLKISTSSIINISHSDRVCPVFQELEITILNIVTRETVPPVPPPPHQPDDIGDVRNARNCISVIPAFF